MKKKFFLPVVAIIAVAGAITFSAFRSATGAKQADTAWFSYSNSGDVNSPLNYNLESAEPECPGNQNLCAIQAEVQIIGGVERPVINSSLEDEIDDATENGAESTNVKLRE